MKIEQQVCTLEQAKRLKELGVEQLVSLFEWTVYCPDPTGEKYYYIVMDNNHPDAGYAEIIASAFTVAELGIMLPDFITVKDIECFLEILKDGYGGFIVDYTVYSESGDISTVRYVNKSEAEARASMLIHLLENSLTTSQDINNRIK